MSTEPHPIVETARRPHTRLSAFIRANVEAIVLEWSGFAKTRTPASDTMTSLALQDHIREILAFISNDLESPQTGAEQVEKSKGDGPKEGGSTRSAAEIHAAGRLNDGFDIEQLVAEYRALRASVIKLWRDEADDLDHSDVDDLTRFNEAIDQATAESISHYTRTITRSRNLFLGILGHDLRNPMGAASMSAEFMLKAGGLTPKQKAITTQIVASTFRANVILTDLLDLTRLQLGSDMPISKETVELGLLAKQLVSEMRALYPGRKFILEESGDTEGLLDRSRMGQVLSNLIGNAVSHGSLETPITLIVEGGQLEVTMSVHNLGTPIPDDKIGRIFDSLVRGDALGEGSVASSHLGLGLYITRKIVDAHSGTIDVTSSAEEGTAFVVKLPRH